MTAEIYLYKCSKCPQPCYFISSKWVLSQDRHCPTNRRACWKMYKTWDVKMGSNFKNLLKQDIIDIGGPNMLDDPLKEKYT